MEDNRRPLAAVLGPLLGALLLLLTINWAADYLRAGQEELAQAAKLERLLGPSSADEGSVAEVETPTDSEASSEGDAVSGTEPVTDSVDAGTEAAVTATETITEPSTEEAGITASETGTDTSDNTDTP